MTLPELQDSEYNAGLVVENGKFSHWLILLPAVTDKDLTWQEALDWAKSVGGELPTRFESALLYANVRDQIDTDYWYWTATQHAGEPSWAWGQGFNGGRQHGLHKDIHNRARAVRRVPIAVEE